jgi:polyphenol oxidase
MGSREVWIRASDAAGAGASGEHPRMTGHADLTAADVDPGLTYELPGGGRALFTARTHGNLSSVGGDGAEHGLQARERLRAQLGLRRLARGYQVHGTTVLRSRTNADIPAPDSAVVQPPVEADGQATSLGGLGAMVLTADCLPVALGADGAVAMVHAGWRGLAAGVLEEGVRAVRELGGVGEIVAIIGPGAGPCCYEVGEEVHAAFGDVHRIGFPAVRSPPTRNIDLKAIARDRLLAGGVEQVRDVEICTICDARYFSHRREGARAGRQGAVAWLS